MQGVLPGAVLYQDELNITPDQKKNPNDGETEKSPTRRECQLGVERKIKI